MEPGKCIKNIRKKSYQTDIWAKWKLVKYLEENI